MTIDELVNDRLDGLYVNLFSENLIYPESLTSEVLDRVAFNISMTYPELNVRHGLREASKNQIQLTIANYLQFHAWNIAKRFELLSLEYNPIENYDRNETVTTAYGSDTTSATNTSTGSGSGSSTEQVAPYDSNTFNNSAKSESIDSSTNTSSGSTTRNAHTDIVTSHIHGNIGILSSQKMWLEQWSLAETNFYAWISELVVQAIATKGWS